MFPLIVSMASRLWRAFTIKSRCGLALPCHKVTDKATYEAPTELIQSTYKAYANA
jgi:hypothetical protein